MTDFEFLTTIIVVHCILVSFLFFYLYKKICALEVTLEVDTHSLNRRIRDLEEIVRYTILPKIGPYSTAAGGTDATTLSRFN